MSIISYMFGTSGTDKKTMPSISSTDIKSTKEPVPEIKPLSIVNIINLPENRGKVLQLKDDFGSWNISDDGRKLIRTNNDLPSIESYHSIFDDFKYYYLMMNGQQITISCDGSGIIIDAKIFKLQHLTHTWI